MRQSYRAFKTVRKDQGIFDIVKHDVHMNNGANIGLYEHYVNQRFPGCVNSTAIEPSQGTTLKQLKHNVRHMGQVEVINCAVSTQEATALFNDRTGAHRGNSSRSCLASQDVTYVDTTGVDPYVVDVKPFHQLLTRKRYTVCKIDIEGEDVNVLLDERVDWSSVRLLMVEYSFARERKKHPDDCRERFAKILYVLSKNGFTHAKLPNSVFEKQFWFDVKHPRHRFDENLWFYRQGVDETGRQIDFGTSYLKSDATKWVRFKEESNA